MTGILLILLLPVIRAQRVTPAASCPVSCVVCSEDAVICQRLAHIIEAPDSTQALLLTEGSISTVQPASLSELANVTVIGLSHNHISELAKEAFRNLSFLHTLLLDHNLLTSQALQGGALAHLSQLKVLALGHNLISMIKASWFKGTKALLSLKLEGNLLTSLDSDSFPLNELQELESLDLSDNLIDHLDRNSFRGLVSLRTLDLSRNRLTSAPAGAFSYLSWLTNLNLDLNSWNCSCELLELAAVLSTFIQQPDKTLYNSRRMVCVSTDNPAVTTVLELTEANCVPSNQNITVQIETRSGVRPQLYARDLVITAVICFIGGVALTLLAVLIYHQVSRRKELKQSRRLKEEEEERSSTLADDVSHLNVRERTSEVFLKANSIQPWSKEAMILDARTDGDQFRSRAYENGGLLQCPDCSTDGSMLHPIRKENWMNGWTESVEGRERRRMKMMRTEEVRMGLQKGNSMRDVPSKFHFNGNMNSSSHPLRETLSLRNESLPYQTGRDMNYHSYKAPHCERCHKTYRQPEQNGRHGKIHPSLNDRGRNGHYQFDKSRTTVLAREMRNVTFDLESLRNGKVKDRPEEETKEKGRERSHKVQSNRLMKVRLNLNPLHRSKVHPRRKNEQEHTERSRSTKKKRKKEHGRQKEEKEKMEKSGKKTKNSNKKMKRSSKTEGLAKDNEEEPGEEEGQNSATSARAENDAQENAENTHPAGSQPAQSNTSADQPAPAAVTTQAQGLQSSEFHYKDAGLALGRTQISIQHPGSSRNNTANLSLTGAAGSQLTGSSLSLQGGNLLFSNATSGSNKLLPGSPVNSRAAGISSSGPSTASRSTTEIISRGAAGGAVSSVPSLLANIPHASPFPARDIHTDSRHLSQTNGLTLNLANPDVNTAAVPPDNSLAAALKPVPGLLQLPPESQAPFNKESLSDKGQDTFGVTPQDFKLATAVENMSTHDSQAETGYDPGGSTVDVPPEGVAPGEGPTVEGYREGGWEVPGVSGSSTEAAGTPAALLQQEFLSEEGGSSPRRKLRLVIPEKTSSHPPTALEKKIR